MRHRRWSRTGWLRTGFLGYALSDLRCLVHAIRTSGFSLSCVPAHSLWSHTAGIRACCGFSVAHSRQRTPCERLSECGRAMYTEPASRTGWPSDYADIGVYTRERLLVATCSSMTIATSLKPRIMRCRRKVSPALTTAAHVPTSPTLLTHQHVQPNTPPVPLHRLGFVDTQSGFVLDNCTPS